MKRSKRYAVILAGGSGTRFWPLSRRDKPKQFLPLWQGQSLFQATLDRIKGVIPTENIVVVSGQCLARPLAAAIKGRGIPSANVLLEPDGKNTAPAICWAAAKIFGRDKAAEMVVLPADHVVKFPRVFKSCLTWAFAVAQEQYLVTLGIPPTRPEIGYGYIKVRSALASGKKNFLVDKFTEKPDLIKARKFLASGRYFWNSGMFVWRADQILTEFSIHLPAVYEKIFNHSDSQVRRAWSTLPNISIDYAILEKAEHVAMVPAQGMGWSDVGSWESLHELLPKDKQGNVFKGRVIPIAARDSLVYGGDRPVAVVGLKDVVIVDTADALLVCRREKTQNVRDVVARLKISGATRHL